MSQVKGLMLLFCGNDNKRSRFGGKNLNSLKNWGFQNNFITPVFIVHRKKLEKRFMPKYSMRCDVKRSDTF